MNVKQYKYAFMEKDLYQSSLETFASTYEEWEDSRQEAVEDGDKKESARLLGMKQGMAYTLGRMFEKHPATVEKALKEETSHWDYCGY